MTILVALFALFGVDVNSADIEGSARVLTAIGALIGAGVSFYGRYRHGDISLLGSKKPQEEIEPKQ